MASLPSSGFGLWRTAVNSFNGSADNNPSYIMDLACDASELHAAVAGSEFDLKLYERETLRCSATLATEAHSDRINELSHAPTGSAVAGTFFSASSDGHVRGWDATVPPRAGCSLDFRGKDEVWSVSASDGALVATGTQTAIVLWDVRKPGSPFARLEVHTEPVTAVRFQPGSATALVSGSIDELICSIDCRWVTRRYSRAWARVACPPCLSARHAPHAPHALPAPPRLYAAPSPVAAVFLSPAPLLPRM
jgi:WD40 repeat protein